MLISALNDYYDILADAGEVAQPGTSSQKITHMIMLRPDGTISDIIDVRKEGPPDKNGKTKLMPIEAVLPERTQKSGIDANIIEHRPLYIFGLNYDKQSNIFTPEDRTDKAKKSHKCFAEDNLQFTEDMTSDIVTAYRNFIKNWAPENETENSHLLNIAKEYSGAYFIFCLDGHPEITLHSENGEIMQKVKTSTNNGDQKFDGICAVTGKPSEMARIHDKIKGILGGQASGGLLVSFKNSAFESYGKKQSYNGSISIDVMKRYTEALNILIREPKHHMYLEELTVVFWAMSNDDSAETDAFMSLFGLEDDKADASEVNEMIANAVNALSEGRKVDLSTADFDENVMFYVTGLAPNSSRIAQKFIYRNKYGDIFTNTARHQADMLIDGSKKQISIWRMLYEMKSPKNQNEKTPAPVIAAVFGAILNGTRYPDTLLEIIVRRVKTDKIINYVRAGILKAYINRNLRLNQKEEEIKVALDKTNTNEAYLCGRLFAVLERIQKIAADTDLNKTIKDSYFSSACSRPMLVLPRLIELAQNHLKKCKSGKKTGSAIYYNKLMGEIIDMLGTEFPSTLSLQDQGRFIIGYYQQRHDFFKDKNNENNNTEGEM